jgi:glutamyl-tRNA synthetase
MKPSLAAVRVRFAPSPTGYLHVGGLRTALYNFLFARHNGGVFILRIEDTDRNRYVEGAVENLIETLHWAGLDYDEGPGKGGVAGPYVQSERLALYREHALKLVDSGKAYYAFDTPEELEAMRKQHEGSGLPVRHERLVPALSREEVERKLAAGIPAVIRMTVPENEAVAFDDIIRGRVEFSSEQLDNQVLVKSDGYPTYHLANVVDDHCMGVTHVVRGEEWLSSTPKHVLLYRYFGWDLPVFAHLPLLLNPDKTKLSKRQGDVAVEDYRKKGYLPEALVNFVALLGWNPGDEGEVFSLEELVREFSLERVGKSGAVFNLEKLNWMNAVHLRSRPDEELARLVLPALEAAGLGGQSHEYMVRVVRLMRERIEMPSDLAEKGGYFFRDPETYDEQSKKKNWKPDSANQLTAVRDALAGIEQFDHASVEGAVRRVAEQAGVGASKLIHPLRLAVTGLSGGPGLFELMVVLGKDACLRRIASAVSRLG